MVPRTEATRVFLARRRAIFRSRFRLDRGKSQRSESCTPCMNVSSFLKFWTCGSNRSDSERIRVRAQHPREENCEIFSIVLFLPSVFARMVDVTPDVGFRRSWCRRKACATFFLKVLDLHKAEVTLFLKAFSWTKLRAGENLVQTSPPKGLFCQQHLQNLAKCWTDFTVLPITLVFIRFLPIKYESSRYALPKAKACAAKAMPWLPRLATAKAWAAHAKACAAKAMPWLPRHATAKAWAAHAKACAAKAMPWLPRHATAKAWAANGQGMCCQGNAMAAKACHGQGMGCPWPRHVLPRQCHGCQGLPRPRHGLPRLPRHAARHATPSQGMAWAAKAKACAAKAMPWLPRHATAKAWAAHAKACAAKAMPCQGMPRGDLSATRPSGGQNGSCDIPLEISRSLLSNDIRFARIGVWTKRVMAPESRGVGAIRFSDEDSGQTGEATGELRVASCSWSCSLCYALGLIDQIACRQKARATLFLKVLDLRETELGLERYGPANRGHRSVFGSPEDVFPIEIPARPGKILAIRKLHAVSEHVLFMQEQY
uniref:Uncharacterized protein n=1 Tax=Fagus sylvatica TaxID=28930 RepID=A0A2N9IJL6_FAGSY